MGWVVYVNTKSTAGATDAHKFNRSLVVLSASRINAAQEVTWYLVYAAALWLILSLLGALLLFAILRPTQSD